MLVAGWSRSKDVGQALVKKETQNVGQGLVKCVSSVSQGQASVKDGSQFGDNWLVKCWSQRKCWSSVS